MLAGPSQVAIEGPEVDNSLFTRTIEQWSRSAVSLVEEVLLEGDENLRISRPRLNGNYTRGSISSERSEPHEENPHFNARLQLHKYKRTVEIVELLRVGELFNNATQHLQEVVEIRKLLAEAGKKDFDEPEQQDMLEQLADLNILCETEEGTAKARGILEKLNENCDIQDPIDLPRSSRLHHKLGKLLFDGQYLLRAYRHLQTSIALRLREDPRERERIIETYELLRHVLSLRGNHAEFLAIQDWIEEEIGPLEDSPHNEFDAALAWARLHGFHEAELDDMNRPKFDVQDEHHRPLLFAAIADNDMEVAVLEQIIQHSHDLEIPDGNGETPLMAAVVACHVSAVRLLLENGACASFKDKKGRNIIHKCQTEEVAEEIFTATSARRPSVHVGTETGAIRRVSTTRLIISPVQSRGSEISLSSLDFNARDLFGKTALYHACEKGNRDVVSVLLQSFRADPEICGPEQCTPLMATIQAKFNVRNRGKPGNQAAFIKKKVDIVRLLIAHGADRKVTPSTLRSAGVAHAEIKKILESKVGQQGGANTLSSVAPSASSGVVEEEWHMVARNDTRLSG
ncbi:ankyrin repeat-containing domain protein [Colletotrichum phormii]|uniref:Ankyrin repeat-containing domain protein n=1 Tax=Colletotrichum phormii TaxID=359342 RepID=A0AAJ0E9A3_9PEZI|nr:ankyrin repeat-containing domain protein [Colletotrichum phormii]KAK1621558.1 ankyrin repeat-containing domain protein [Colletotrichum phormii]